MRPKFQQGIRSVLLTVLVAGCGLWLAACSSQKNPPQAVAAVEACGLLSETQVQALAPGLSAGHPGKLIVAHTSTCEWDNARHLSGLILQVSPADSSGVKKELEQGFANMGYDLREVTGLGGEAAVAVQRADPAHGLETAVAELVLRVGKRQLLLSPVYLNITPATTGFRYLKTLAAQAAANLRARQSGNTESAR